MKSCAVVIGLLVGCIIAAACGYFDRSGIDAAPVASFIWVHTFPLQVYGPLVLPLLAVYVVITMETIGDVTATCDVSRLQVDGPMYGKSERWQYYERDNRLTSFSKTRESKAVYLRTA